MGIGLSIQAQASCATKPRTSVEPASGKTSAIGVAVVCHGRRGRHRHRALVRTTSPGRSSSWPPRSSPGTAASGRRWSPPSLSTAAIGPLVHGPRRQRGAHQHAGPRRLDRASSRCVVSWLCGNLYRSRERLLIEQSRLRESESFHRLIGELASDFAFHARIELGGQIVIDSATSGLQVAARLHARGSAEPSRPGVDPSRRSRRHPGRAEPRRRRRRSAGRSARHRQGRPPRPRRVPRASRAQSRRQPRRRPRRVPRHLAAEAAAGGARRRAPAAAGRHRQAPGGRGAAAPGQGRSRAPRRRSRRSARRGQGSRASAALRGAAEGRIPRHARARTAQSAGAAAQRRRQSCGWSRCPTPRATPPA